MGRAQFCVSGTGDRIRGQRFLPLSEAEPAHQAGRDACSNSREFKGGTESGISW